MEGERGGKRWMTIKWNMYYYYIRIRVVNLHEIWSTALCHDQWSWYYGEINDWFTEHLLDRINNMVHKARIIQNLQRFWVKIQLLLICLNDLRYFFRFSCRTIQPRPFINYPVKKLGAVSLMINPATQASPFSLLMPYWLSLSECQKTNRKWMNANTIASGNTTHAYSLLLTSNNQPRKFYISLPSAQITYGIEPVM